MTKKFRIALGLWVTPDFADAEARRSKPPRVDHDVVNFSQLRALLQSTFTYGPPVEFLVPNDTVDQVTAHIRMGMFPGIKAAATPDLCACRDFGVAMLQLADKEANGVIDVRAAWERKHAQPVKDRRYAPPPSMLPFVVVADEFEDAMIWQASTRPVLGLEMFDPMKALAGERLNQEGGRLPATFRKGLKDIFGCSFVEFPSMMDRLAMDEPPPGLNLF